MNTVLCINIVALVIFIYIEEIKTEDYEDRPDESNLSASVDSESNEVYNSSAMEKPRRLNIYEDSNKKESNGNILFNKSLTNVTAATKEELKESSLSSCNKALSNYPYSVSIQRKGSHYASGALIDKKWIVTVATEFYNVRETIKLFRARLGTVNCKRGGLLVPIKEIEVHPSYVYRKPNFDIAMLKIAHTIEVSDLIKPIAISDVRGQIVSANFLTTYWPRLIFKGQLLDQSAKERMKQNSMRVSTQKMILWEKCYELMITQNQTLDESSLCLAPIKSHHSPCMPDAGAPIAAEDGLWGITSGWTTDNCLTESSPTIVTRTSSPVIRAWLDGLLYAKKK